MSTGAPLPLAAAHPSDANATYALLEECSAWLRAKGVAQWNPVYPRQLFEHDIEAGSVWVWRDANGIRATVTLTSARPAYYPSHVWSDAVPAWYICRLAVARALKGHAVGIRVLQQVERRAITAQRVSLRLDVTAENEFLAHYYEALDFRVVTLAELFGTPTLFLEKGIGRSQAPNVVSSK